jgi:hypothetical protein
VIPLLDELVSDHAGPGELVEVGAALAVAEHPPVLPGLVDLAKYRAITQDAGLFA